MTLGLNLFLWRSTYIYIYIHTHIIHILSKRPTQVIHFAALSYYLDCLAQVLGLSEPSATQHLVVETQARGTMMGTQDFTLHFTCRAEQMATCICFCTYSVCPRMSQMQSWILPRRVVCICIYLISEDPEPPKLAMGNAANAKNYPDTASTTCADCRLAATWLPTG